MEPYARALVYQWLFFEQYSHEPYIAVARFLLHLLRDQEHDPERIALLHERGNQALGVMETVLEGRPWIAGDDYSIADIALYAYTHVAETGGFDLSRFPAVTAWLNRVANQPGHFGMEDFSP